MKNLNTTNITDTNTETILVVTHKNCMDGVGAAAVVREFELFYKSIKVLYKEIQHGTPEKENFVANLTDEEKACDSLIFTDMSLDAKQIQEALEIFEDVTILDHHKTALQDVNDCDELLHDSRFTFIYEPDNSGVGVVLNFLEGHYNVDKKDFSEIHRSEMASYIEDRDLWKWEMPKSKEYSEGLRFLLDKEVNIAKTNVDMEDLDKEFQYVDKVDALIEVSKKYYKDDIIEVGEILLEKTNQMVLAKIQGKLRTTYFGEVEVALINTTENISEIGNGICLLKGIPACMYFVLETGEVVFSFRSMDHLPDASLIAKAYGGGGHRNACGFKGDLSLLTTLYPIGEIKD
jgi:oligoribonuclease NrnB/cAMP/cGMP phosphodiesterase (DHH superfamily)